MKTRDFRYIEPIISFWKRLIKYKSAFVSLIFLLVLIFSAIFAEYVAPHDPLMINTKQMLKAPSWTNWFGTDYLGRDIFSRVIYGGRVTLLIGFTAGAIMTLIGLTLGLFSGYFGGTIDLVLMRITEIFMTIPILPLILLLVAIFGSSITNVVVVISVLSWPTLARVVRAEALSAVKKDYIMAEHALGASDLRIIFYHLLPNITGSVIAYWVLGIAWAILNEAALDFLGLAPFTISWGYDLSLSLNYWISGSWWMVFFPGFAIFLTCFSFYLISDGLNKVLSSEYTRE
jgi:peptide/nickel transport system permease protein